MGEGDSLEPSAQRERESWGLGAHQTLAELLTQHAPAQTLSSDRRKQLSGPNPVSPDPAPSPME